MSCFGGPVDWGFNEREYEDIEVVGYPKLHSGVG